MEYIKDHFEPDGTVTYKQDNYINMVPLENVVQKWFGSELIASVYI
eukprot:COSAG02_NODE_3684_length_6385_cov_4.179287_2_plen_46_part_00